MQGAAPQGPQQSTPQGPQPRQGMAMAPQNNPSMSAAMDLATDELDALGLDPRTKAMLKTQEAYDLMQSAQRELAMAQQQPMPPTIEGQRTQQTMQGIGALMQQLSPGIQQQGQQMAMAQRRPPMQGQRPPMPQQGVSGMPARNMQGMARGGVVGYAGPDGSQVQAPQKPILFDEMGKQITKENSSEMFKELTSYDPTGPIDPTSKRGDKEIRRINKEIERLTRPRQKAKMLDIPRKGNVFNTDAPPELLKRLEDLKESRARIIAARNEGMARGGIVGYAGPDGSQVGSVGGRKVIDSSGLTDRQKNSTPAFGMTPTASPMLIGGILKGLGFGPKYDFGGRRNEEFALESARRNATPIPIGNASQPIPMLMEKYGAERVTAFIAEQKALKAKGKALTEAYGNSRAEAEAAGGLMQVEDLELMEEVFAEKYRDILNDSMGMARGGIVGFDGRDGSQVQGLTPAMQREVEKIELETQDAGAVPLDQRELMAASLARVAEQRARAAERDVRSPDNELFNIKTGLLNKGYSQKEIERIISAGPQFETTNPQTGPFPPSLIGGNRTGIMSDGGRGDTDTFAPEVGVDTSGAGSPQSNINTTLSSIAALTVPETEIGDLARSPLRDPIENAALKNIKLDASALSNTARKAEQGLASQAYAMSPEMKAAYARQQQERDAYYTAQLDPKRLKDQKINALLAGLASDGGIAKSGIAALQGVTGVGTAAAELGRKQSEERFGSAKEREGINREGKIKGYEAGSRMAQAVYERTSATVNQASQSLSQLATSDETRGQAAAVQEYTREMDGLKLKLNVFLQQEKISQDDRRNLQRIVADMRNAQSDIDNTITDLRSDMLLMEDPEKTAVTALIQTANAQRGLIQQEIDATLTSLGIDVAAKPSGGGGNLTPEQEAADAILGI